MIVLLDIWLFAAAVIGVLGLEDKMRGGPRRRR